jgi:UDP:flavonoid glycosyltransferase YjiC (YdhE family)
VLEAIEASGVDADLLLGGKVQDDSARWLAALPARQRARVIVHDGFHPDAYLDQLVAASDVAAIALTNNGPSGIMGKALTAGVPVVSAGSHVRAGELRATGGGIACELTVESFAEALRRVLTGEWTMRTTGTTPPATGEAFAAALLGVDLP